MASRDFRSLEDVNAFLQRRMDEYNAAPQAELGGLSPVQMYDLLSGDWKGSGPLRLAVLPPDVVAGSAFVGTARLLLQAAGVKGGLQATATGNLGRAVVREMLDRMAWPEYDRDEFQFAGKVLNETDVWALHIVRLVLGMARLLRRRSGRFHTTQLGRTLSVEEAAGLLQVDLFRTLFRQLNLVYLAPVGPEPTDPIQSRAALLFLRLAAADDAWRSADQWEAVLAPDAPPVREVHGIRLSFFGARWLRPLEWFGLLEGRDVAGEYPNVPRREYRRTPLAVAFLRFPPEMLQAVRPR
jgi:hypothetical protein